jgi:hypothetical protein
MFSKIRRRLYLCSKLDVKGFEEQLQGPLYMPESGTYEEEKPCQNDQDIVVEDSAKDTEPNVDFEHYKAQRDAYATPYHALRGVSVHISR